MGEELNFDPYLTGHDTHYSAYSLRRHHELYDQLESSAKLIFNPTIGFDLITRQAAADTQR